MTRGPYTQFAWHMGQWVLRKTSSTANDHSNNLAKNNSNKHENKNNKSYNPNASVQSAQSPGKEGGSTTNMTNTTTTNSNQEYVTSSHEIYFEQGSE